MKHKIGYHAHSSIHVHPHVFANANAPLVKVMGDAFTEGFCQDLQARGFFVVARYYLPYDQQHLSLDYRAAETQGRNYADKYLSLGAAQYIDAAEVYNEVNHSRPMDTPEWHTAFDAFHMGFAKTMKAKDIEPVAWNFSNGYPVERWIEQYKNTLMTYRYFGFHGYGWPTLQQPNADDLMLRYRQLCLPPTSIKQFILTECGVTKAVTGGPDTGWRSGNLDAADYFADIVALNDELMKDDYVLGACLYDVGAPADWATHDPYPEVTALIAEWGGGPDEPKPPPEPEPDDCTAEYKRGYADGRADALKEVIDCAAQKLNGN